MGHLLNYLGNLPVQRKYFRAVEEVVFVEMPLNFKVAPKGVFAHCHLEYYATQSPDIN